MLYFDNNFHVMFSRGHLFSVHSIPQFPLHRRRAAADNGDDYVHNPQFIVRLSDSVPVLRHLFGPAERMVADSLNPETNRGRARNPPRPPLDVTRTQIHHIRLHDRVSAH